MPHKYQLMEKCLAIMTFSYARIFILKHNFYVLNLKLGNSQMKASAERACSHSEIARLKNKRGCVIILLPHC
jgi:hypothetical protein